MHDIGHRVLTVQTWARLSKRDRGFESYSAHLAYLSCLGLASNGIAA